MSDHVKIGLWSLRFVFIVVVVFKRKHRVVKFILSFL